MTKPEEPTAFTRGEIEAAMAHVEAIVAGRKADEKAPPELVEIFLAWATRIVPGQMPF